MSRFLRTMALFMAAGLAGPHAVATRASGPGDLEALWGVLGSEDPVKVQQAVAALVARPKDTIPFLRLRLLPVPGPDAGHLARLTADLDSDQFEVREGATRELLRLGEVVEPHLRKVLAGQPSLEVRRRIERLLEFYTSDRLHPGPDRLRQDRAIEVLELIGDTLARQLLERLARGAAKAPLTRDASGAVERLRARAVP